MVTDRSIAAVKQARRILVGGSPGTGKTTFSYSASAHAGDTLPQVMVQCLDVAHLEGDIGGHEGGMDANLQPAMLFDMTVFDTWAAYEKAVMAYIVEIKEASEIKVLVVDLSLPTKLLVEEVKPQNPADWNKVGGMGLRFFRAFNQLSGVTIIGNSQLKSAIGIVENDVAKAAAEAKSSGGERSTFEFDMVKSVLSPWYENGEAFAREVKRVKEVKEGKATWKREYFTHTSTNPRFPTKSRHHSKLPPTLAGNITLWNILNKLYAK